VFPSLQYALWKWSAWISYAPVLSHAVVRNSTLITLFYIFSILAIVLEHHSDICVSLEHTTDYENEVLAILKRFSLLHIHLLIIKLNKFKKLFQIKDLISCNLYSWTDDHISGWIISKYLNNFCTVIQILRSKHSLNYRNILSSYFSHLDEIYKEILYICDKHLYKNMPWKVKVWKCPLS
jgi:hypothetical protein